MGCGVSDDFTNISGITGCTYEMLYQCELLSKLKGKFTKQHFVGIGKVK